MQHVYETCRVSHLAVAGFWCISGSATATPLDGVTGSSCPEGSYCPTGTPAPVPCPAGTWSNSTGLAAESDCLPCTGGYYCDGTGLTAPSGPCSPMYYCSGNASSATPQDGGVTGDPCTRAHYCPEGTASPIPCPDGTYTTVTHTEECLDCTPGYYCVTGDTPEPCPAGYYCPLGTGYVWESCPAGTFSDMTGKAVYIIYPA